MYSIKYNYTDYNGNSYIAFKRKTASSLQYTYTKNIGDATCKIYLDFSIDNATGKWIHINTATWEIRNGFKVGGGAFYNKVSSGIHEILYLYANIVESRTSVTDENTYTTYKYLHDNRNIYQAADRQDVEGSKIINWQTYTVQEPSYLSTIYSKFGVHQDTDIISTPSGYEGTYTCGQIRTAFLEALREANIQEWIPTVDEFIIEYSFDSGYEYKDYQLYLDNVKAGVQYKTNDDVTQFTDNSSMKFTVYKNIYTPDPFVINSFVVPTEWTQDTNITIAPTSIIQTSSFKANGPTGDIFIIEGEVSNMFDKFTKLGETTTGRHVFDYFCLNKLVNKTQQLTVSSGSLEKNIDIVYKNTSDYYKININGWKEGDKIALGETKVITAECYLPFNYNNYNQITDVLEGLELKSPEDTSHAFKLGTPKFISTTQTEYGIKGTVQFTVRCVNRSFGTNTKIYLTLTPKFTEGLSDKHIPCGEIYFYQAPELKIPEGTVLNIYNDKCDKLMFTTFGFSSSDLAEFNVSLESNDLAEFEKRNIEFDFTTRNTTNVYLIFKDDVDDRNKRVFYNFTDREFKGTIKFRWKVNGEEINIDYEIPVIYHNTPDARWQPKGELTIPADESSTSYTFNDVMKYVFIYGHIYSGGLLPVDRNVGTGFTVLSDQNIFETAEFNITRSGSSVKANLIINGLQENYYVNPRQTRVNVYLQYTDDEGNLQYIDDKEMWPQTQITITQEGLGFVDPVIDDDTLYGVKEEQTILRLNNMVSTPITQNNYSVNMETLDQPQLSISDDLYFLDASPVYVDGNQKQVILKYYTSLSGIPSVKYTNTEGFLPGIKSVELNERQKQVIVNMNYNKGQTTQGYVTLTIGNRSVSMGVFQNRSDEYFELESESYSVPYMNYGFGIKYTTNKLTPSDIKVRHASGDRIMTSYSVNSQVIVLQVGQNPMLGSRTEFLEVYVQDGERRDVFVQSITLTQDGNPKGMNFTVETDDGSNIVFWHKTINGAIYAYGGQPTGYRIVPEIHNVHGLNIAIQQVSGDDNKPVFNLEIEPDIEQELLDEYDVSIDFKLMSGSTLISTKTMVFNYTTQNVILEPKELIFNYRGVADEGINYFTVFPSSGDVMTLLIDSNVSELPFTVRFSNNQIYITGLEARISSTPKTWTVNCKVNTTKGKIYPFSFKVTQLASPHTYEYPIWKDIYVDLPEEHNYFRLVNISSGFIMYEGMIYGFITSQVGVTDVLRDYMTTVSDPFVNTFTSTQYLLVDMQTSSDGSNWQSTYTFRLYYNYSYDEEQKVYLEAQPIDYFDPRQYLLFTFQSYDNVQENVEITKTLGTSAPQTQTISSYNEQKTYVSRATSNYSIKIKTSKEERIFKDRCTNTNYAVYYINRYGGWSWMLFQGKNLKTDKTKQSTYKMDFDNNVGTEFNTKVYQNDVTETWQLTSDYLSDKQSELLKHLYSSPLVYLHDLKEDKVMSVLVDTKSFDYKTYRNQGRKMFTHTIKVNGSQTKIIL